MKGVNGAIGAPTETGTWDTRSYQDVKMHKSKEVTYHCNGQGFANLADARVYKKKKNIMYGYVKHTIEERTVSHIEICSSRYVS